MKKLLFLLLLVFTLLSCQQTDKAISTNGLVDSTNTKDSGVYSSTFFNQDDFLSMGYDWKTKDSFILKGSAIGKDTLAHEVDGAWVIDKPIELLRALSFTLRYEDSLWLAHYSRKICFDQKYAHWKDDSTVVYRP